MAKHYYTVEVVTDTLLDEDDLVDLEFGASNALVLRDVNVYRTTAEYVDSDQ